MKPMTEQAAEAAIRVACRELHLPTIAAEHPRVADDATRERLSHRAFLAEVLAAEVDERAQRRKGPPAAGGALPQAQAAGGLRLHRRARRPAGRHRRLAAGRVHRCRRPGGAAG